jgi:hypothetical protein
MYDVVYYQVLNKIKLDVDVQVLFVDVYVVAFLLAVIQHSKHYYQLEYQVDVPMFEIFMMKSI